jgi:hypothetical protein
MLPEHLVSLMGPILPEKSPKTSISSKTDSKPMESTVFLFVFMVIKTELYSYIVKEIPPAEELQAPLGMTFCSK